LSDDIPRRINKIEEDVSKVQTVVGEVNTEIAIVKTKIDEQDKHLQEIKGDMRLQTNILNKLLTLTDRHDNFEKEFKCLKEDYVVHKEDILSLVGTMRGIVLAGAVFVSMLVGMGLYIYADKIKLLDKHEIAITQLQKK
jgi:chromosome segregation ATPase